MPAHKVRLEICGSSYVVSTNDSEEYLIGLAEKLDTDIKEILAQTPNASVASAAIITALSYLDQADKNASGTDNMRQQLQSYLEDAAKAKSEAETYRKELETLRAQVGKPKSSTTTRGQRTPRTARTSRTTSEKGTKGTKKSEEVEIVRGQMGIDDLS